MSYDSDVMTTQDLEKLKGIVDEKGRILMNRIKNNVGTFSWWLSGIFEPSLKPSTSIATYHNLQSEFQEFKRQYKNFKANSLLKFRNKHNPWVNYFDRMDRHIFQTQQIIEKYAVNNIKKLNIMK